MKPPLREIVKKTQKILAAAAVLALIAAGLPAALAHAQPEDVVGVVPVALDSLLESRPGSESCELGCVAADAVRRMAGADLAVVNGGDLARDLNQGQARWKDVQAVFVENRALAVISVTPAGLKAMLETAVSRVALDPVSERIDRESSDYGGFAQVSGFTFEYDASAPAGDRIVSATLSDGKTLDLSDNETALTLAASAHMLGGGYGYEPLTGYRLLGAGLSDALAAYIAGYPDEIANSDYSRIEAIGSADDSIAANVTEPVLIFSVIIIIMILALFSRGKPVWKRETEHKEKI